MNLQTCCDVIVFVFYNMKLILLDGLGRNHGFAHGILNLCRKDSLPKSMVSFLMSGPERDESF